jgi:outer membrane protein assembly factor BamB
MMQYSGSLLSVLLFCHTTLSSEVLWQRDLETRIVSPPVVWKDKIIVVSQDGGMTAFEADGSKAWERLLGTSISSHPVITKGGEIFVVVGGQKLLTLNLRGETIGEAAIDDCPFGPSAFFDGQGLLPAFSRRIYVANQRGEVNLIKQMPFAFISPVVVLQDGNIVGGTDKATLVKVSRDGQVLWEIPDILCSGKLAVNSGGEIFTPTSKNMLIFKSKDGALVGGYSSDTGTPSAIAISEQNRIFTVEKREQLEVLPRVRCFRATGELEWFAEVDQSVQGLAVDRAENVYCGTENGTFYCLSSTGTIQNTLNLTGKLTTPPVLTWDGRIYICSEAGILYCISAAAGLAHSPWPMSYGNPGLESDAETGLMAETNTLSILGKPGTAASLESSVTPDFRFPLLLEEFSLEEEITRVAISPTNGFYRLRLKSISP